METITLTYNEESVQAKKMLNYILTSGFLVPKIENEPVLVDVPFEGAPCRYSVEELKARVRQATASIRAGRGYTAQEMKTFHPRQVKIWN